MSREEDIKRMIDETVKKFGRIDILFNQRRHSPGRNARYMRKLLPILIS